MGSIGGRTAILATASSPSFDSAAMPARWTKLFALIRKFLLHLLVTAQVSRS